MAPGKPSKSRKSAETSSPPPDTVVADGDATAERTRRTLPGRVITVTFLMTVLGGMAVLSRYLPDLRDRPEYQFRLEETRITPPHEWVPPDILKEVITASGLPESVSLLDPDLCRKVARAWEANPWVRRVISVQILPEPALVVELEYRKPAALIRVVQGFYPVDQDGVLLPPRDFSAAATERLPHVRNITSTPSGGAGTAWGDPVVEAAARLAMVLVPEHNLARYWSRFELKSIVAPSVSDHAVSADQLTFELETAGGNRIVWGRPPGSDSLEPTPDVKLARLAEYQSRFGSLDGVSGRHRIDIRLFDGISLQPLDEIRYR